MAAKTTKCINSYSHSPYQYCICCVRQSPFRRLHAWHFLVYQNLWLSVLRDSPVFLKNFSSKNYRADTRFKFLLDNYDILWVLFIKNRKKISKILLLYCYRLIARFLKILIARIEERPLVSNFCLIEITIFLGSFAPK